MQNNAGVSQYGTPTSTPTIGVSTPNPGGRLPETGFDSVIWILFVGVFLLALGVILFRGGRR